MIVIPWNPPYSVLFVQRTQVAASADIRTLPDVLAGATLIASICSPDSSVTYARSTEVNLSLWVEPTFSTMTPQQNV